MKTDDDDEVRDAAEGLKRMEQLEDARDQTMDDDDDDWQQEGLMIGQRVQRMLMLVEWRAQEQPKSYQV